ncbi:MULTISPECIES: hypothetical protein [Pseudomonas]|uniref:hypothetical protein n=1 Tax=Pseudomonas TaxID=286 RepID=UPI00070D22A0|nr:MULTISPECIES: hypothetical protein [Pseudomonas]KQW19838.1 hypothetical protein ASC85_08295 [Pseudomonas sp. Root401]WHS57423.1 conjugal transfer protein TraB [Pseudomonas brassicacearum]
MSDDKKEQALNKKNLLIAGGVLALGLGATIFGGKPTTVQPVDVGAKPIEVGTDQINDISVKDRDAALTVFAKSMESFEQKLALQERDFNQRDETLRKEWKDSNNTLKAQVATLSDEIVNLRSNGIEATYQNANKNDKKVLQSPPSLPDNMPDLSMDGGLNFDKLNFNMSAPKPQQDIGSSQAPVGNPYGPNYFILKPTNIGTTVSKKSGGDSLNASEQDLFNSMSTPAPQNGNYNNPNADRGQASTTAAAPPRPQQYDNAAEAYAAQAESNKNPTGQTYNGTKMERITIPAFSFVEVTTLHGVACPIGANSPGAKQTEIPARPVVLPVRGIFRGPNGSSVDVGSIHLMALCSGRRTSSSSAGRANIRVEQMSYWDEAGDSQMAASTGYIVDTRDNEQDVYGRLDKASGRTLALESMAAAGAAFAAALSQAEYTTQNSLDSNGASSVQQLTGSATKSATTQGIAAIFNKIAGRFEQEANAAIDTVVVEPGIRLRFVTDQPIHVFKPAEAFDLDAGKGDVLL